jgi:hypothetical protein
MCQGFKYLKKYFQILFDIQCIQKCGNLIFLTFYFIASNLTTRITRYYYDRNCRNFYHNWSICTLSVVPRSQAILRFLTTLYKNLTKSLYVYRFFVFFFADFRFFVFFFADFRFFVLFSPFFVPPRPRPRLGADGTGGGLGGGVIFGEPAGDGFSSIISDRDMSKSLKCKLPGDPGEFGTVLIAEPGGE